MPKRYLTGELEILDFRVGHLSDNRQDGGVIVYNKVRTEGTNEYRGMH